MEFLIGHHIKVAGSGKPNTMVFSSPVSLALHRLVNSYADRMAAFRSGKDAFHSCELLSRFEYRCLLHAAGFDIAIIVQLGQDREAHAVVTQAACMVGGRDEKPLPSVYILARGQTLPVSQKSYTYFPLVRLGQEAGSCNEFIIPFPL